MKLKSLHGVWMAWNGKERHDNHKLGHPNAEVSDKSGNKLLRPYFQASQYPPDPPYNFRHLSSPTPTPTPDCAITDNYLEITL